MSVEQSPAFQFYPREFVGDLDVAALSLEQIGFYTVLLCFAWMKDGLPNDFNKLARALHVKRAKFDRLWLEVGEKFELASDSRWRNKRQEEERAKQAAHRAERSLAGQRGNAKRYGEHRSAVAEPSLSESLSDNPAVANARSSSSIASSSSVLHLKNDVVKVHVKPSDLLALWNAAVRRLPKAQKLTEPRRRQAQARLQEEPDLMVWRVAFDRLDASDFASGQAGGWRADFDFVIRPGTLTKIQEGKYDNRAAQIALWGAGRTAGNPGALAAALEMSRKGEPRALDE